MNVQFKCSFVLFSINTSLFLNSVSTNCFPLLAFFLYESTIFLHFPVYGSYNSSGSQDQDSRTYRVVSIWRSMISILDLDEEVKSKRMLKGGAYKKGYSHVILKCFGLTPLHNAHCTFRKCINFLFFLIQTRNAYPRH